jgi:hypothetical protein
LVGALVIIIMELRALFNIIDTPLKIDAHGVGKLFVNTNDYGKRTW